MEERLQFDGVMGGSIANMQRFCTEESEGDDYSDSEGGRLGSVLEANEHDRDRDRGRPPASAATWAP
jgi:hypothetical protein